jgi:excisionase family DNA binding protein
MGAADTGVERLLSVSEAAEMLGVPTSWIYSAAEGNRLPSFKLGKYRRFKASELTAWLEKQRGNGR